MNYYMNRHKKPPKTMPKKETEALLRELREIRQVATMETANFFPFVEDSEEKMNELRALTRVWRQSWIIEPLDRLIERYESHLE